MAEDKLKHSHSDSDIIIKDQDGKYKILRDGKFIDLSEVESAEMAAEHSHGDTGPKRSADQKEKHAPQFKPAEPKAAEEKKPEQPKQPDVNQKADEAINKSGVTFASGEIRDRVLKALVAHIKGIRKPFETRETLMRAVADGGAGLPVADAERVIAAAGGKPIEPMRPKMDVAPTKKPKSIVASSIPVGGEVAAPPKVAVQKEVPSPIPVKPTPPPPAPTIVPKPSIADVKKPARPTIGLASELAYSLADWRRVEPNPKDRNTKIINQLGVLEEDRYPQKTKGINAWRESAVFKLYLNSGETSLAQAKPLQELLGQGGADQLSWEEWQAIAELNERIRV